MSKWLRALVIAVVVLLVLDRYFRFDVVLWFAFELWALTFISETVAARLRALSPARLVVVWGTIAAAFWGMCVARATTVSTMWYIPDSQATWLAIFVGAALLAVWFTGIVLCASWPALSGERGGTALGTAALICGVFALQVVAAGSLAGQFRRMDWTPISRRYTDGVPPLGIEPSRGDPSSTAADWFDDEVGPGNHFGRLGRLYQRVADAVVFIGDEDAGFGSGFLIRSDGLALTAFHVVAAGGPFHVRLRDGTSRDAHLVRWNEVSDVALLQVECGDGCPWIPVETRSAAIGDPVIEVGHPFDAKLSYTVTQGIVSGIRELDGAKFVQTDAASNGGNSGGPIVSVETGRVIAIVSWGVGRFDSGLNFGVATDHALEVLGLDGLFWPPAP